LSVWLRAARGSFARHKSAQADCAVIERSFIIKVKRFIGPQKYFMGLTCRTD